MGRSRKPKKSLDELETTEPVEEKKLPGIAQITKQPRTHFTVLLKHGVTYEFEGMVFHKGIPKTVEMKYLKKFETNGWFTVTS